MSQKLFLQVMMVLFGVKALFGVYYLLQGWSAFIGPFVLPFWFMVVAVVVDGFLSWKAYQLVGKKR